MKNTDPVAGRFRDFVLCFFLSKNRKKKTPRGATKKGVVGGGEKGVYGIGG